MKKNDLFQMLNTIDQVSNMKGNVKFAYGIAKNRKIVQSEVDTLRDLLKPGEEFEEFEKKRLELCGKMCKRDEEGKPITKGNTFVMEDPETFEVEFKKLQEEYKDAIEEQGQRRTELDAILKEDVDLEFFTIDLDYFPNDITSTQMQWLMPLVKE